MVSTDRQLRVLYVTDSLDAPYRYRCENAVLQLRQDGVIADVASLSHPDLLALVPNYSVVVLFRLAWSAEVEAVVERARRRHVALAFDIDDLIFSEEAIQDLTFLKQADSLQQLSYRSLTARLQETMRACRYFIGSTARLSREASREGRHAFTHPNLLHPDTVKAASRARACQPWLRRRAISYLSGSNTHDADIMSIAPAIARVMRTHQDVFFLAGGFVQLPEELASFGDRIVRAPFVDWRVLPWIQSLACCNLAPLAELNAFSHSKSPLKFFEAAIAGTPTAATPTSPMRQAIVHGENGFLPETHEQWVAAMEACLNPESCRRIAVNALRTTRERFTLGSRRGELRNILSQMADVRWKPTEILASNRPMYSLLCDSPGKTLAAFQGSAAERRSAIVRILRSAPDLRKLDSGAAYRQPVERLCRTSLDLGPAAALSEYSWQPAQQLQSRGDGRYRAGDSDPFFVSEACSVEAARVRYLHVTMQLEAEQLASVAQLYWISDRQPEFSEERSIRFAVIADGREHTYLVDLHSEESGAATAWREAGHVRSLRFDPCRCPGFLRLSLPHLLPSAPTAGRADHEVLCA